MTTNTIGSGPSPSISENLQTGSSGNVTGTVTTSSARNFRLAGFVNTSHGRVDTEVRQSITFRDVQNFNVSATVDTQDISQQTNIDSYTTARQGGSIFEMYENYTYPLTLNYTLTFASDGSATQVGNVSQEYRKTMTTPFLASFVDNQVESADALDVNSSFQITGNSGASSTQTYNALNTSGQSYSCTLKSENNTLTAISQGCPTK